MRTPLEARQMKSIKKNNSSSDSISKFACDTIEALRSRRCQERQKAKSNLDSQSKMDAVLAFLFSWPVSYVGAPLGVFFFIAWLSQVSSFSKRDLLSFVITALKLTIFPGPSPWLVQRLPFSFSYLSVCKNSHADVCGCSTQFPVESVP
jgi:hypothetical protein